MAKQTKGPLGSNFGTKGGPVNSAQLGVKLLDEANKLAEEWMEEHKAMDPPIKRQRLEQFIAAELPSLDPATLRVVVLSHTNYRHHE